MPHKTDCVFRRQKDLAAALPAGPQLIQRTKVFKAKVFPPADLKARCAPLRRLSVV
jgi:hypothetical protein